MAVKVKRERPDQRRHHRVTAPLYVSLGGHTVRATDWSLGGLRIDHYPGDVPSPGAEVKLTLMLPFQGFDVSFDVEAEVVRRFQGVGSFALQFKAVGERERELMSHFVEELVRGSMVDVEDTIQRIDVPVTPASLEPDKPRTSGAEVPLKRWPTKLLVMSGVYVAIGLVVFAYAGLLIYSNVVNLEVQTAVVAAPIEVVTAQAGGRVGETRFKPGQAVKAGDLVLEMIDNQLEREIELAEIAVSERKAKLIYLKQRHIEELERIGSYATIEMKNLKQTERELEALTRQLDLARQTEARMGELKGKGFTTLPKFEEAQRNVITLSKDLDIRQIELRSRLALAGQNLGRRLYTGHATIGSADLTGRGAELEAEIRLAEHEITLARQRQSAYLGQRRRQSVVAPFDGVLLELPRFENASVRAGDIVAVIEQRDRRHVLAFLNQDEVARVGLGDAATLYLPALGETLEGRVTLVDRTSGFIREQDARQTPGYGWRGPTDRSAKVVVEFADPAKVVDTARYRPGLPVVVVFGQRTTNPTLGGLSRLLPQ